MAEQASPRKENAMAESLQEEEGGDPHIEAADEELDEEAKAILAELDASQAEVQQMLADQKVQTNELGGLRDSLVNELHELQEESWKMELYGELEVLKRQLAALQGLETDLDAAEAVLDATEPGSTPSKTLMGFAEASSEANVDNEDDADFDVNSIAEMQTKLDEELAEMFAQLKAIKEEAATASARKVLLEAELKALLEEQEDDTLAENADGIVEITAAEVH